MAYAIRVLRLDSVSPYQLTRRFAPRPGPAISAEATFEAPNANRGARLEMELFQNVFDVLLDGACAAPEDLADLAIPFSLGDPFHDLAFAFGQRPRISQRGPLRNGLY